MNVDHIVISVPARNEEDTLSTCLESIRTSRSLIEIPTTLVVVLDACTDATAAIAHTFDDVRILERTHRNVGRARHDAIAYGLHTAAAPLERTWIAFTDADTTVPAEWLPTHLAAAQEADAYVGAVIPRLSDLDDRRRSAWHTTHPPGATIGHVHGANLGVRASAYLAVGGIDHATVGEDVDLIEKLRKAGHRIIANETHPVVTSARLIGRAHGGYADYLRNLLT
ncbi:glycosyltransferase [Planctomonas sp. JC2975]|uniref:glycosyltransferase n=1 Tax=Planctomonas sp. JC2975 TaxID=2729626 RepID=UPI0014760D91|nr:glycosyltransferase [Planctomonas sp. JC2975]NNC14091.1 glycosyltransferase [Planctomonas sp. JC2975]